MLSKEAGNVEWTKSAAEIERLVRGLDPWPGAYSFLNGKMIRLRKTAAVPEESAAAPQEEEAPAPGTLLPQGGKLYVMTGGGLLEIAELQPEGKKPMPADAYLRGARLAEGSCFTRTRS